MMGHTPGPWIVTDVKTVVGSLHLPNDVEELSAWYDWHQADGPDCHFIAETATDTPEGEANAAFIVKCVNSHYDLVEALQSLFNSYKELADSGDAGNWHLEDQPEGKQALAALHRAKGD